MNERLQAKLNRLHSLLATRVIAPRSLEDLYKKYGIARPAWSEPQPLREVTAHAWLKGCDKDSRVELMAALSGQSAKLANSLGQETPDGELGAPGTPIQGGIITVEPTVRLRPYLARGYAGTSGIFEELRREPVVYRSTTSIKQLLVNADWHMAYPKEVPDTLRPLVEEAGAWAWAMLLGLEDGWKQYVEDALSGIDFGFSPHEIVWHQPDGKGRQAIKRLAYREQSTVREWLFDRRGSDFLGARFQTGGDGAYSYALPAHGERLSDHRLLVNTLAGRGNNLEGLPPVRTVEPLITLKRLLIQIFGVTAERYGAPLLTARADNDLVSKLAGAAVKEEDQEAFLDDLMELVAADTAALQVPTGLILEFVGAQGEMPRWVDMLQYLDTQIALAFNAQAALLGQQGVGSYALAQTQDGDFLRSAPYYAELVTRKLNRLLIKIFKVQWGLHLQEYPQVSWRLGAGVDTTAWLANVKTLVEIAPKLPPEILKAALEQLDLSPDAFDDLAAQRLGNAVEDQQRVYKITNALKSRLVARTTDGVRALHQLLDLPEPSEAQIAELLSQTVPGAPQDPDVVAPEEVV